jgi:DNA-binding transcriptional MerR regulator/SAM-dependent methyltransferase
MAISFRIDGDRMRIGKFAEENGISIDTARHYMEFGLIIPEKRGGQYYFDEGCKSDLKEILSLKGLGFSLNEIKTIFMFRRLGKLSPYQEDEYYRDIFISKDRFVGEQIQKLTEVKKRLEEKIKELSQRKSERKFLLGVDIKTLDLLRCVKCGGALTLSKGSIVSNQIIDGELTCSCGETYRIEEGILIVGAQQKISAVNVIHNYLSEYINETDPDYLNNVYRGMEWGVKRLCSSDLEDKTLMELGSGSGFFLRNAYSHLPESCLYIAVDHDIERHRFLKNMLKGADHKRNVLFICSDFSKIPLKDKSVDALINASGTSNYSFEHDKFLLELIDKHIKEDAVLVGSYILFNNFGANTLIAERYRKNFIIEHIKKNIGSLRYKLLEDVTSDYVEKGGKYEDYFIKGEKVYSYMYYGKR